MTPDQAKRTLDAIFADFSAEERETFRDNVERRLGLHIGEKLSPKMHDKVARIVVEEIQMVLMARDA
jgi:hypothetical protein